MDCEMICHAEDSWMSVRKLHKKSEAEKSGTYNTKLSEQSYSNRGQTFS